MFIQKCSCPGDWLPGSYCRVQYCDRGEIDASNRDHPGAMTFQQLQNVQFESERNIPFILAEQ